MVMVVIFPSITTLGSDVVSVKEKLWSPSKASSSIITSIGKHSRVPLADPGAKVTATVNPVKSAILRAKNSY